MDPQQEIFTAVLTRLRRELDIPVYDGFLPSPGTPYPFIYLGENWQNDTDTKNKRIGTVDQMIHVWHDNPRQRGRVSKALLDIKIMCRSIARTQNFKWDVMSVDQNILADTSTAVPLMHGVLTVGFHFS